jgi:hypothetical protein
VDDRDVGRDRRVVEDVAGLERVGPVEDHVVAGDDPLDVLGDEHLLVGDDLDLRVERVDRLPRRLDLALADPVGGVTIWRWRLLTSTMSKSTIPIVPTPAAARYSDAGEPRPPAPMSSAFEPSSRA